MVVSVKVVSVKDVADGLALLAGIVRDTRAIVQAVNDGRAFLKSQSPQTIPTLVALLGEIQVTIVGLAEVAKLLTGFAFNQSKAMSDAETVRFNDYLIKRQARVKKLRGQISSLKGSCDKINLLSAEVERDAGRRNMKSMWGLLGAKVRLRSKDLSRTLSDFYGADQKIILAIEDLLRRADDAILDIQGALGEPGYMYGINVPIAAARLQLYAAAFKQSEEQLDQLVEDINIQVKALKAA